MSGVFSLLGILCLFFIGGAYLNASSLGTGSVSTYFFAAIVFFGLAYVFRKRP
jgi:TRAP-type C4-dicarboxylate transport system permease small subunit